MYIFADGNARYASHSTAMAVFLSALARFGHFGICT